MKKVNILIPVAPFEPLSIIKKSVVSLSKLKTIDIDMDIMYIIDCPGGSDERTRYLKDEGIGHLVRNDTRGRRGGAINDGLDILRGPGGTLGTDFIVLFDVDSRPDPDFIPLCIDTIERDADAIMASGARYITNQDSGWITRIIAAEYSFFEDVYSLYERFDGFKQFNGLIGVIDARTFDGTRLNEAVFCEDLEFTQRIYIAGKKPVLARTMVGEQGPTSLKELYNQRVRWLSGALEGVEDNIARFFYAHIPINQKIAWFTSMTLPFAAFLLSPFVPVYGFRLWNKGDDRVLFKTLGLIFHVWLISFCGVHAVFNRARKTRTVWTDTSRSDI
ncbi:MAG: glycosyltransferase family 2 protein [ANME-2 cluster archaeon]|nr:glycosyltransferase family 2 protein [ANME-2 cluster archaeon]